MIEYSDVTDMTTLQNMFDNTTCIKTNCSMDMLQAIRDEYLKLHSLIYVDLFIYNPELDKINVIRAFRFKFDLLISVFAGQVLLGYAAYNNYGRLQSFICETPLKIESRN